MSRVFISYSKDDRAFVQRLVDDLHSRIPEVEIFYDMLIESGASWVDVLSAEIEKADVVLAVLSPQYFASPWARHETMMALDKQARKPEARLIPLIVHPCEPAGFLAALTYIDFTEDYEAALLQLIWGITGQKPKAAKGEEPGTPSAAIAPAELDELRHEVQEAVRLFKSRVEDLATAGKPSASARDKRKGKPHCFVIMPFGDPEFEVVYEDFVKPTVENECELTCERGDDVFGSNIIMDDILRSIDAADIVLADLTQKNANVFYEVGICHALQKPVLLLSQSIDYEFVKKSPEAQ